MSELIQVVTKNKIKSYNNLPFRSFELISITIQLYKDVQTSSSWEM